MINPSGSVMNFFINNSGNVHIGIMKYGIRSRIIALLLCIWMKYFFILNSFWSVLKERNHSPRGMVDFFRAACGEVLGGFSRGENHFAVSNFSNNAINSSAYIIS